MIEVVNIKYTDLFIKVDLDTGESLQLTLEIFSFYSLSKGKIIDNILYQQLKEESERFKCKQKALNYLATSSRSFYEMRTYLLKKGFSKHLIEEVLMKLRESGYINDEDYAVRYIINKQKSKIVGRNLLKRDLFKKGISRDIINSAIKATDTGKASPDDIYGLALKKFTRLENKKNKIPKLIYFLKQKGFDEEEVRSVLERLKIEGDA